MIETNLALATTLSILAGPAISFAIVLFVCAIVDACTPLAQSSAGDDAVGDAVGAQP